MGAPPLLVDMYLTMREDWILTDEIFKLHGHHKMHSGEPFTLVGNTLFGMFVIARSVLFDDLAYAAFKGDDSAICGVNVRFDAEALGWCSSRGLQLKVEYPPFMEFTGLLVTKYGFFPDVVRRTAKFLSNVFHDNSHYKEAVMNLDAELGCLTSVEHLLYGAQALSEFYRFQDKTNPISADSILLLVSFLSQQKNVHYDDLVDVDKSVFTAFSLHDYCEPVGSNRSIY
jgi:hypothetical protein